MRQYQVAMTYSEETTVEANYEEEAKMLAIARFVKLYGRGLTEKCDIDVIGTREEEP